MDEVAQVRPAAYGIPDLPHYDSVACVYEVDGFKRVCIKGLALLLPLAYDCLSTHDRLRSLRPTRRVPHDDVRVVKHTEAVHISCIPSLEDGSHNIHVLLRHRQNPTSRCAAT